ncbi:MAG: putative immunity protein [Candidatus Humimicrobiaceae bacterium]
MKRLLIKRESKYLQPLSELIKKQKHKTLVLWSIDCAGHILPIFEKNLSTDERPRKAIEAAKAWAQGEIKMPVAKKAAHAAHNAAAGHVVGTVHVSTHAIGFVIYAITAFIHAAAPDNPDEIIEKECDWLYGRLLYWEANIDKIETKWASFLEE